MNHQGTRRIETERLILRRFEPEDAPNMYKNWASDPEVTRFLTWPVHGSVEATRQIIDYWIKGYEQPDRYDWALEEKASGEVIGSLAVVRTIEPIGEAAIGYCMGRRWWGQGLMPEAVRAVIDYLLDEVGYNRICATHDVDNPKSGRVMQKAGMTFEGVLRQGGLNNLGVVDIAMYSILKSDPRAKR